MIYYVQTETECGGEGGPQNPGQDGRQEYAQDNERAQLLQRDEELVLLGQSGRRQLNQDQNIHECTGQYYNCVFIYLDIQLKRK